MPRLATTDIDIARCFDVLAELRPHLCRETFVQTIREMQADGFNLVYLTDGNDVVAAAGYRIYTNLYMGKHCYVDDLVTATVQRSKGYGEQLIKWLRDQAREAGCAHFHLDSGTHRGQAHKVYFAQGFTIASYHFSEELK
tara:strand:- start:132 stop:551 length:420 start_codon:yes stop_codon:yes gene_type:complete